MGLQRHLQIFSRQFYTQILLFAIKIPRHYQILILRSQEYNDWLVILPFALYCKILILEPPFCYNALLHNTPGYKQTYAFPNPHESTHSVSIPTDFHLYRSKYNSKNYIHNIHSLNNDLSTQM